MAPSRRAKRDEVLRGFRQDYNNSGWLFSVEYTGILEALHRICSLGIKMFVLTNKPDSPTRKILTHLMLDGYFTEILSPDSISAAFSSKAEGALYLCHALIPDETVLMSDSLDDLNAARAAGLGFLEAGKGHRKIDKNIIKG